MLVAEIVITGGPCAGKTTAMAHLCQWLRSLGFRVLVVPEMATTIISGGVSDICELAANDRPTYYRLEREMIRQEWERGLAYRRLATDVFAGDRVVILRDRSIPDMRAYTTPEEFDRILDELGLTLTQVRDRSTGVIHLVTAADGAEEHYTTANNAARSESPEQARAADRLTLSGWVGHPRLRIIDNSTGFKGKLQRLCQEIAQMLEVPMPVEHERKYRLLGQPDLAAPLLTSAEVVKITQTYLIVPDCREDPPSACVLWFGG